MSSGRHVVLTGVTGFVGKVVLERLIRERDKLHLTGVTVIVRAGKDRKGNSISPAERFASLAKAQLFDHLPSDWTSMVSVVAGDLEKPRCGLSGDDFAALTARATQIVHCAASVEFDLPVAEAAAANITTVLGVLDLARACPNLVGMVDVSTAYVSVWRPGPIAEKLAHLPRPAEELYRGFQATEGAGGDWLALTGHPNTYTLTKCVAEHLIAERRGDVPVVIVRPSIVSAAWRAPFAGWIDSPAALAGVLLYIGLGVVRTFNGAPDQRLDVVPVDVVAHDIIEAAFGAMPKPGAAVPIRHSTMGTEHAIRIDLAASATVEYFRQRPGVVQRPDLRVTKKGFAALDLWRRELPTQLQRAALAVTRKTKLRARLETADERVRYMNECFEYFTKHTFDFQRSTPNPLPGYSPRAYLEVINAGLYRHLVRRDETQMPFAGPKHDDKVDDATWLAERTGPATLRALAFGVRKAMRRCTSDVTYDRPSFQRAMAQVPPDALVVLAPSHRSYLDFLLAAYLCFQDRQLGIAVPHIAAAEEFGRIPVIGKILRESQAFFIKRGLGCEAPELSGELRRLAAKNASLMFFVEGQRSRSRLFLAPKRGLLRALQATGRKFVVLPIAMSYDRLPEEHALARELKGGKKPGMSLGATLRWLAELARGNVAIGRVHVSCGAPQLLDGDADVKSLSRALVGEQQRATTVSSFHLRAFLHEERELASRLGLTEAWLRGAIEARGGRVLDSDLPLPEEMTPTLGQSLRNQWIHWFYGDALTRYPDNVAVGDHVARNAWISVIERDDRDPMIDGVVDALMAPIIRDYRAVVAHLGSPEDAPLVSPVEIVRNMPVVHLPHVEDAFQALVAHDIVRPADRGVYAWGDNAQMLDEFRARLMQPAEAEVGS